MSVLMSHRDRQRDATRALLLDAAARLVGEHGPEYATTRAIAREAGVATGTVFAHFPDKTALLEALLVEQIRAALDATIPTIPAEGVVEQLVTVAEGLWATYDRSPALSRALLSETLFLDDPERPLSGQLHRFSAWVAERLVEAASRGEIAPIDPALAFASFFAMYFALLVGGLRRELSAPARGPMLRAFLIRYLAPSGRDLEDR